MNAHFSESIATFVPLRRLRPGHDHPAADINMRKTYEDAETRALAESIRKEGVLQSLLVTPHEDDLADESPLYIAAGGRRHAALMLNEREGHCTKDYLVPVIIDCALTPQDALSRSMIENDCRVPPHPADRYEAFAALEAMGITIPGIAGRFGVKEKSVRQALALGALSPAIRDAWRKGDIGEETAKAFTLAADHKTQDRTYVKLKKKGGLTEYTVRRELRPDHGEIAKLLAFVGMDAYRAAGGAVTEDFFAGQHAVSDDVLLKAMANDRLDKECQRLKAEGWSWAEPVSQLPADWRQWRKTEPVVKPTEEEASRTTSLRNQLIQLPEGAEENADALSEAILDIERAAFARGFNAHQKGIAGCAIEIDNLGGLEIRYGIKRPGGKKKQKPSDEPDAKRARAAADADGEAGGEDSASPPASTSKAKPAKTEQEEAPKPPPMPSNSAMTWLSEVLTDAAAKALQSKPDLGLKLIIAAVAQRGPVKPLALSVSGRNPNALNLTDARTIADTLADLEHRTGGEILELMTRIAAASLDMTTHNASSPPLKDEGVAAITAALGKPLIDELRLSFDLKEWFGAVPKALALEAILEGLGEEHHARAKKLKAKEIAAYAAENLKGTGWLPTYLRTAHYTFERKEAQQ